MQFYLTALNATQRLPDEGPAIGIILCREKRRTVVEYALASTSHPVGVASYVVSKDLPKKLKGQLPTEAQISRLLDATDSYLTAPLESGNPIVQPLVAQLQSSRRKAKTAKKVVKSKAMETKRSSRK